MNIVLDTNIIISAIWTPGRNAGMILNAVFTGRFTCCYDYRIINEYSRVMHYPRFGLKEDEISAILSIIEKDGLSVIAPSLPDVDFSRDETDRKFYEVAKFCNALLITGNTAHYPNDPIIIKPAEFCDRYLI